MKLSGIVAILDENLEYIEEYRDLGPEPVAVKRNRALPVTDIYSLLLEHQEYGEPSVSIDNIGTDEATVTRTFPAIDTVVEDQTSEQKLAAFLEQNPDVLDLIQLTPPEGD